MNIKEMRYPVQRTGGLSAKMREAKNEGRKEGRKKVGRKRSRAGYLLLVGEIRSSGIMEFLSPLEAQH